MPRGYEIEDIKEKLLDLLANSKTGFSGLEISDRLGINRITVSKYLNIFSAEGLIKQKNIGNVIIWFVEDGIETFHFPEDFFKARTRYSEYLISKRENLVYTLIKNCFHSAEKPVKIITEIIVPGIVYIQTLFDQGKIGKSELTFMEKIISNSIQIINLENVETDQEKNVASYRGEEKGAVTHDFADGQYIRTIVMPKGLTGVSEIHAKNHPYFIMQGEVSVFSEKGIQRIKAPYHGITEAGTQRLLYIHEECIWITIHRSDCLTPAEVKAEVLLESFDNFS